MKVQGYVKVGEKEVPCVGEWVESFKAQYERNWWKTPILMPMLGKPVDKSSRKQKEKRINILIDNLCSKLENYPKQEGERAAWQEETIKVARIAGAEGLGIEDSKLSDIIFGGFMRVTNAFMEEAAAFNPDTSMVDIMQAMRNVWIMNCMQVLLGREIKHTSSIFAYSMLYPVTDNYMDDPGISAQSKLRISKNFRRKLSGEKLRPENSYEKLIFRLIDAIEGEYSRIEYPCVYDSLLSIHKAQEKSMEQQRNDLSPYESNILDISFEKGGTSVLADAFLVNGSLCREDGNFIFGFGVILQLIDDLQDADRDMKNGHMTIFSQTAQKWKLDSITNRLFNFLLNHMKDWMYHTKSENYEMMRLIEKNCILLMMEAIARNKQLYSKCYLKYFEAYSPYSFAYLERLENRLKKKYSKLAKKLPDTSIDAVLAQAAVPVKEQ